MRHLPNSYNPKRNEKQGKASRLETQRASDPVYSGSARMEKGHGVINSPSATSKAPLQRSALFAELCSAERTASSLMAGQ